MIYEACMKKISQMAFCMALVSMVIGCSGEARQSEELASKLPILVFQEIHPENEGKIAPVQVSLDKWSWELGLTKGSTMSNGYHFEVQGEIPEGLEIEIVVLDRNTVQIQFVGSALNHHVSQSVENIELTFTKNAFLNASPKALDEEDSKYRVHIVFGKGYTLSGIAENLDVPIEVKLLRNDETITIHPSDPKFRFSFPFEEGEPYEMIVTDQPEDTCCTIVNGFDTMADQNVENIEISCNAPQWTDPEDTLDTFSSGSAFVSIKQDTLYDQNKETLEILSVDILSDNEQLITHLSYKPQHGLFVKPETMDIADKRVIYKTEDYPTSTITNLTFDINEDGLVVVLLEETNTNSNSKKLYTLTFLDNFNTLLSGPTLIGEVNFDNSYFEVNAYKDNRAVITYFNSQDSRLYFSHFNGTTWSPFQAFGVVPDNNVKLVDFDGEINENGYGVFALKYRYINPSPFDPNHQYKVFRTEFFYNSFTEPEQISVPMFALTDSGEFEYQTSECIEGPGCDCDGLATPISCNEITPLPSHLLEWHADDSFFFPNSSFENETIFVSLEPNDDASIFWFQIPYSGLVGTHHLMHAEKQGNIWNDPNNINDFILTVIDPKGGEIVSNHDNAALFIHSEYSFNQIRHGALDIVAKRDGEWILNNEGYMKIFNPLESFLSDASNTYIGAATSYSIHDNRFIASFPLDYDSSGTITLVSTSFLDTNSEWTLLETIASNVENFGGSLSSEITNTGSTFHFWSEIVGSSTTRLKRAFSSSGNLDTTQVLDIDVATNTGGSARMSTSQLGSCGNHVTFFRHQSLTLGDNSYVSTYN